MSVEPYLLTRIDILWRLKTRVELAPLDMATGAGAEGPRLIYDAEYGEGVMPKPV